MRTDFDVKVRKVIFEEVYDKIYREAEDVYPEMYREGEGNRLEEGIWGITDEKMDNVWRRNDGMSVVGYGVGETISLTVILRVGMIGGGSLRGRLAGRPVGTSDTALRFTSNDCTLRSGEGERIIKVTAEGALPDWPTQLVETVQWRFDTVRGGEKRSKGIGRSGPHGVLVTFGPPIEEEVYKTDDLRKYEDGATPMRMVEATRRASAIGCTHPVDFIDQLFAAFPSHVLKAWHLPEEKKDKIKRNPRLKEYMRRVDWGKFLHFTDKTDGRLTTEVERERRLVKQGGVWPLADLEEFGGECQAVVRFIRALLRQLGFRGETEEDSVEMRYVAAHAADPYRAVLDAEPIHCSGPNPNREYGLVDYSAEERYYSWTEARQNLRINNFEAFLRYRYKEGRTFYQAWYSGGAHHLMDQGMIERAPQREKDSRIQPEGKRLPREFRRTLLNAFSGLIEYKVVEDLGNESFRRRKGSGTYNEYEDADEYRIREKRPKSREFNEAEDMGKCGIEVTNYWAY